MAKWHWVLIFLVGYIVGAMWPSVFNQVKSAAGLS